MAGRKANAFCFIASCLCFLISFLLFSFFLLVVNLVISIKSCSVYHFDHGPCTVVICLAVVFRLVIMFIIDASYMLLLLLHFQRV